MSDLVERLRIVDSPDYGKNIHLTVRREDVSKAATALTAKDKEIEALGDRVEEAEHRAEFAEEQMGQAITRAETAERERDEARAALKPLVERITAGEATGPLLDMDEIWVSVGHLRAARAVIEQGE